MKKGIVLDRDGTLIDVVRDEETGTITTAFHPRQIRILPGVIEGLKVLQGAGYVFAIATNQPGPAKGHFSADAVRRTNDALVALLADEGVRIQRVAVCLHHPDGAPGGDASLVGPCDCRKPKPGLLEALIGELDLWREQSWMIGDSAGDVEAGRAARIKTGLVFPRNRCELCPLRHGPTGLAPDLDASTLDKLARAIVQSNVAPS